MASTKKTRSIVGLCNLPDDILVKILSLLPTKSAVATSLLSTRWRYLWISITNLQLDEYNMFKEGSQFIKFMDRALVLRNGSSLESFSLHCNYNVQQKNIDASSVNAWISTAIDQCKLEKLDLELYGFTLRVPMSRLSNLKRLSLSGVTFANDESTEKLLSSPLLEELTIKYCNWDDKIRAIRVSCPKLKVLDIQESVYHHDVNRIVCFIADNLWSFRYIGYLSNEYQICASSSSSAQLKEAKISVRLPRLVMYDVIRYVVYGNRCYKLINGLSKAHSLTFDDRFLLGLEHILEQVNAIPIFEYLTRVNLEYIDDPIRIDRTVLMKLFERSPHLEILYIGKLSNIFRDPVLSPMPMCFRTHLKRIYIDHCRHHANKDGGINFLLNSCAVLEEMVIGSLIVETNGGYDDVFEIEELQKKLNRLPRDSKDCKIVVKKAYINSKRRRLHWPK